MTKINQTKHVSSLSKSILSYIPLVLAAAFMVAPLTANAGFFDFFSSSGNEAEQASVDTNPVHTLALVTESPEQAQAAIEVLRTLADTMTRKMSEIEPLIDTKQNSYALNMAKSVLDEVRVKSGIDPKAKLRENLLTSLTFPEGSNSMATLPVDQQQTIIRTVQAYKGGLYLDIINLTKRVSLLYVKALHAQFKAVNGLTSADRNKILKDLATASIIPMPMQDKKGKVITVFDEDVANEDHIYMFNREITNYLYSAKDLGISEANFEKYRSDLKNSILGIVPHVEDPWKARFEKANACYNSASALYSNDEGDANRRKCFYKFKFIRNIKDCMDQASNFYHNSIKDEARNECIEHFHINGDTRN